MKEFDALIRWIEEVPKYGRKDGLNNMRRLMEELGNPQEGIPVIHVAGTNGKGSCCAMLTRILTEAGYKTGRYTSPHLVDYRERITVGEELISREDFVRLGERVREAIRAITARGEAHATYFEILTAIAFCYFAEQQVDWIVLETGVGGRLDATNIVAPRLCLITSVSRDHMKVLGNTLEEIAGEKAGILKPGVPAVLAYNPQAVYTVVKGRAREKGCPFVYAGNASFRVESQDEEGLCVTARGRSWSYEGLKVSLRGDYQVYNLMAVLEAAALLQQQGVSITEESLRRALAGVTWPGRMEYALYRGHKLLMDGAHNGDAAERLAAYLETYGRGRRGVLVFSALEKKDVEAIIRPLAGCRAIQTMVFAALRPESHSMAPSDATSLWMRMGGSLPVLAAPDTETALRWAAQEEPDWIVCAGSLYLIGEIREILYGKVK